MTSYEQFLERKKIQILTSGFDIETDMLNPKLFDFQKDIVRWALRKGKACIFADCGLGKGQPIGSKILTPSGWKNIEDLKVGDLVYSSKGKIQKVTGVYPKNEIDTYRFYYSDGVSAVFDIDHLHICRTNNDRQRKKPWRVISTKELIEVNNLRYGKNGKSRNYDIPIVEPIQFPKKDLYISPYVLGVLLGDGYLKGQISISNKDPELLERFNSELPKGVYLKKCSGDKRCDFRIKTGLTGTKRHLFRQELINLGLYGTASENKFIPDKYLFSSVEDRIDLLRGLMDTDGYIKDTCQYYTVSKRLKDDVKFLIQSVGGVPTESIKKTAHKNCYVLTFSLKTVNPFYISRKAKLWNPNPRDNGRWIDRIEFEKKQKTVCISVDSPDESYVTEHFIVTHNTAMQLEWAYKVHQNTFGDVLIVAPLAVAEQTKREGEKFNIHVTLCRAQADVKPGINITNYEMLQHFDTNKFIGVVLDESSILKHFTSKMRTLIIDAFADTEYKLACTATPAPNDYMELGNHSEFVGAMTRAEMLSMFFVHDGGNTSKWRLKGHAEDVFWKWMTTWAVVLQNPRDLQYEANGYDLPELRVHEEVVITGGELANTLTERRNARKETLQERCQKAADIANNIDGQVLIWCDLNAESELLKKLINNAVEVKGSDKPQHKTDSIVGFAKGEIRALVTKPSIAGFGINWQNCSDMIFVGLSDSYEQYYQAVRRCWRFGQEKPVDVYLVTSDREGNVRENVLRKESDAAKMTAEMVKYTKDILTEEIHSTTRDVAVYEPTVKMKLPKWKELMTG